MTVRHINIVRIVEDDGANPIDVYRGKSHSGEHEITIEDRHQSISMLLSEAEEVLKVLHEMIAEIMCEMKAAEEDDIAF
jgi:hypothetical protein